MNKYLSILTKCPLFSGIDDESILAVLSCMDTQISKVVKHQFVFREGARARYLGVVLSGRVQVVRHFVSGSRSIVDAFGPSQVFGAAFACAHADALPVSIVAMTDCEILLIDCRRILTVCSNACAFHARMMSNLLQIVAQRNILFSQKLDIVSRRTTRDKLLSFLFSQARQSGSNRFAISYNRQQLADYLGVSRCAMTTELTRLRDDGVIDFHRNEFTLLQAQEDAHL